MSTTIPFITIPQMQSNLGQVAPWDLVMLIQGAEHERAAAIKLKDLSEEIGNLILWTGGDKLGDVQFIKELTKVGNRYIAYLRDEVVDTKHLKDGSVDWDILSDSAVAEAKIQRNAVTTDKVKDYNITPRKLTFGFDAGGFVPTEANYDDYKGIRNMTVYEENIVPGVFRNLYYCGTHGTQGYAGDWYVMDSTSHPVGSVVFLFNNHPLGTLKVVPSPFSQSETAPIYEIPAKSGKAFIYMGLDASENPIWSPL